MIRARGLTRRFGDFTAVENVSFDVPNGAILALLGPNGAGKTTTVRMLAGLIAPSEGEASVAGFDVRRQANAVRTRVGLVTDTPGLYEQMTLPAYLDFFGAVYGIPQTERKRKIAELISFFDLGDHQRERMVGFSKGMKQKVALARALLHDPVALYLDEPTSGLDPLAARAVRELIVGLKRANRVIILCTHDLDEAERLADEIAIMRAGAIVRRGAPAVLRADSSPETTVRIRFAESLPDVERVLAGLSLQIESTSAATELAFVTPDPVGVNPEVIARLVAAGARIVAVDCATRALEDIYAEALGAATSDVTRLAVAGIVE
jgi:ABC-2 type transport system ATP-binding protein